MCTNLAIVLGPHFVEPLDISSGGLEYFRYFPTNRWDVILPIDYFSRWLKPPTSAGMGKISS